MRRRIVGFIAALLAAVMTFGSAEALAGVKDVKGAPVYEAEDPDNILGVAADFGIFAETVRLGGHVAANVACKELSYQNMDATTNGYFYAQKFISGNSIGAVSDYQAYFDTVSRLDIYVGSEYKLEKTDGGNAWNISCNGETRKISKSGIAKEIYFYNESSSKPFINIDSELKKLTKTAAAISTYAPAGVTTDFSNENYRKIVCGTGNNVLNISYDKLMNVKESGYNLTPLYISGIADTDNTLIVNVYGIPEGKEVKTPEIYFVKQDGSNGSPEACYKDTARVLWNFGSFSGTVNVSAFFGGTVLAPAANVELNGGPLVGSVIAKKFSNGNEVHFIPYRDKKEKESEVTVTVRTLDGTCCDQNIDRGLRGVELTLYKKNDNGKYKKVKTEKTADPDSTATWTVKEEGSYYIKETKTIDGYVKSPAKCVFTVKKDKEGILRIYPKKDAKDGNGEVANYTVNDDNTSASFMKFRKYGDSLYTAAYVTGKKNTYKLVSSEYTFKVTDAAGSVIDVNTEIGSTGLVDDNGEAYDIFEAHIKEAGRYKIEILKDEEVIECKYVNAYLMPVGAYIFVEEDFDPLASNLMSLLGSNFNISKIKKSTQNSIQKLMVDSSFDMMTDGCLFFNVGKGDLVM